MLVCNMLTTIFFLIEVQLTYNVMLVSGVQQSGSIICVCVHLVVSNYFFTSKNTGMSCYFLFHGIFLTQGLNPNLFHLLHRQADSLPLYHLGSHIYIFFFRFFALYIIKNVKQNSLCYTLVFIGYLFYI